MACPDCFRGSVHKGTPRGTIVKLWGFETYVSEPTANRTAKGIIVVIPDAFGLPFVNNKLLADHYAEKSDYRVYLPDFMAGWSAPVWMLDTIRVVEGPGNYLSKLCNFPRLMYALLPWYYVNRIGASYPRVKMFFEALRHANVDLPIGAAGFYWGGKHVVLLAGDKARVDGKPLFDAGFTGHPSLLAIPRDIEKMELPVAFAIGDEDAHIPINQVRAIQQIVESKRDAQKGEVKIYPKCGHGFCICADTRFLDVVAQAAAAEDHCIEWFNKTFARIVSNNL